MISSLVWSECNGRAFWCFSKICQSELLRLLVVKQFDVCILRGVAPSIAHGSFVYTNRVLVKCPLFHSENFVLSAVIEITYLNDDGLERTKLNEHAKNREKIDLDSRPTFGRATHFFVFHIITIYKIEL